MPDLSWFTKVGKVNVIYGDKEIILIYLYNLSSTYSMMMLILILVFVLFLFQNRNKLNFEVISTIYIRPTPKTMLYSVTYLVVNYVTLMSIISRFGLMARIDETCFQNRQKLDFRPKGSILSQSRYKVSFGLFIHAWRFHELFSNIFSFDFQSFGNSKNINREIVIAVQKWFKRVLNLCIVQKVLGIFWK